MNTHLHLVILLGGNHSVIPVPRTEIDTINLKLKKAIDLGGVHELCPSLFICGGAVTGWYYTEVKKNPVERLADVAEKEAEKTQDGYEWKG